MTYAESVEVANLAGNKTIFNTAGTDITSTVLTDAIERGDAAVVLATGISTWDTLDPVYPMIQQAAEFFAAHYILMRYAKNDNETAKEAMNYYNMALEICKTLESSSTLAVYVSSGAYKSYPLNRTTGTIHRSLPGSGNIDPMKSCC